MVNPMIENDWFIPKIWIKVFVFVASRSKLLDQKVNSQVRDLLIGNILVMHYHYMKIVLNIGLT